MLDKGAVLKKLELFLVESASDKVRHVLCEAELYVDKLVDNTLYKQEHGVYLPLMFEHFGVGNAHDVAALLGILKVKYSRAGWDVRVGDEWMILS